MWINRGDKMNELQICNENQALIDMQIDACNTAVNFFETNLSQGQRDFVTQMGKLSLKAKEIQLKEDELQTKYDIAEMKENNKFRLATIELRRDEMEAQTKLDTAEMKYKRDVLLAQIKAVSDYESALIAANKEIDLEKLKTEQLRINELSKCHQKEVESIQKAYQFCMDFFYPQIEKMDQQLSVLREQHTSNFENQEARAIVSRQIDRLVDAKDSINKKIENIVSGLNNKLDKEKINYQMAMIPFKR